MNITFLIFVFVSHYFLFGAAYNADNVDETGCPTAFKKRCRCGEARYVGYSKKVFMTNCTGSEFTDDTPLRHLLPETKVLIFTGNKISFLKKNIFGIDKDFDELEVIDFTNNRIKGILGQSFHKVNNVKKLIINHNDIFIVGLMRHPRMLSNFYNLEELHLTNSFTEQISSKRYLMDLEKILFTSELTKLRKLHLEQNEIFSIRNPNMFCDLISLEELHLSENQLSDFNLNLTCLTKLRYLDLEFNKFRRIYNLTLAKFDQLYRERRGNVGGFRLNLYGNPFHCDCNIGDFYHWLMNTKYDLYNAGDIRCFDGYPEANAGLRITNLNHIQCKPIVKKVETSQKVTTAVLSFFLAFVSVLLIALLIINHKKVYYNITPIMKNMSFTSRQYRTIDSSEEISSIKNRYHQTHILENPHHDSSMGDRRAWSEDPSEKLVWDNEIPTPEINSIKKLAIKENTKEIRNVLNSTAAIQKNAKARSFKEDSPETEEDIKRYQKGFIHEFVKSEEEIELEMESLPSKKLSEDTSSETLTWQNEPM